MGKERGAIKRRKKIQETQTKRHNKNTVKKSVKTVVHLHLGNSKKREKRKEKKMEAKENQLI